MCDHSTARREREGEKKREMKEKVGEWRKDRALPAWLSSQNSRCTTEYINRANSYKLSMPDRPTLNNEHAMHQR